MEQTGANLDPTALFTAVRAWIKDDPDPMTAQELSALLALAEADSTKAPSALAELHDRFAKPLQFGTAGLRGAMAGGPNRMNRAVVQRAAAGISRYLLQELAGEAEPPSIVIGYDARHNSHRFALDTAQVAEAAGLGVHLMPQPWPTPVTAFALRHLDADAAVMVTASHNPAQDNGYKVYLGGRIEPDVGRGAQLVAPRDSAIAAHIAAINSVGDLPKADSGWQEVATEVYDEYCRSAARALPPGERAPLRIVYTPLHGVGGQTWQRIFADAGFTDLHPVPQQFHSDPDFPTVTFPNPEEPGALDLALDLAREVNADLVIANDPDADRVAIALPDPRTKGWRMLHGDEVGALLGWQIAQLRSRLRIAPGAQVLASSLVSSRLLAKVAAAHRLAHQTTLTGFKWISRTPGLVFGYEEALGYCVDPAAVRDKDGLSAAVMLAGMVSVLAASGRSVWDVLDDLARQHGLHVSAQVAVRFTQPRMLEQSVAALLAAPPQRLGGQEVVTVADLNMGYQGLAPTSGILLETTGGTRVIIRPSGTEPKVKAYLETITAVPPNASAAELTAIRKQAGAELAQLSAQVRALLP